MISAFFMELLNSKWFISIIGGLIGVILFLLTFFEVL